jgi:hypothetical protein
VVRNKSRLEFRKMDKVERSMGILKVNAKASTEARKVNGLR